VDSGQTRIRQERERTVDGSRSKAEQSRGAWAAGADGNKDPSFQKLNSKRWGTPTRKDKFKIDSASLGCPTRLLVIVSTHSLASLTLFTSDEFFQLKLQKKWVFHKAVSRGLGRAKWNFNCTVSALMTSRANDFKCPQTHNIMCPMDDATRRKAAECLEHLADQTVWNPELWERCHELVQANLDNELLEYIYDDVVHYSGEFHSRNIFGFHVEPGRYQLEHYRQEFRDIATALRSSMSLSEAKKKYDL